MGEREDNQGKRGQRYFSYLAEEHFTVNSSGGENDRKGWDFLLTFPEHSWAEESSYDSALRAAEPKCWVQVKTTRSDRRRKGFALHHWKRFTTYMDPCFFYILKFNDEGEPIASFLVHVGKRLVAEVGKRWFALTAEERTATNKLSKDVTWSETDELPLDDSTALYDRIVQFTGLDPTDYARKKEKWRREAGLPEGDTAPLVKFSLPSTEDTDPIDALRDHVLGYTDAIEANDVRYFSEERWGEREILRTFPTGHLTFRPEPTDAQLEFSIPNSNLRAELSVEMYSTFHPTVQPIFPPDESWVRFHSPFLDFVFNLPGGRSEIHFSGPEFQKPVAIDDLSASYRVMKILRYAADHNRDFHVSCFIDAGYFPLVTANVDDDLVLSNAVDNLLEVGSYARACLDVLDLRSEVHITPRMLLLQESRLRVAAVLTSPLGQGLKLEWIGEDVGCPEGELLTFPMVLSLRFDEYIILLAGAINGTAKLIDTDEGRRLKLTDTVPLLCDHRIFRQGQSIAQSHFDELYQSVVSWAEAQGRSRAINDNFIEKKLPSFHGEK